MGYIDVLIPFAAGVIILLFPSLFIKKGTDEGVIRKKQKYFRMLGVGLLGISVLYFSIKCLSLPVQNKSGELDVVVAEVNAHLPIMADPDTRVDKVSAKGNQFTYHITMINRAASDLNKEMFARQVETILKATACSDPSYARMLGRGIYLSFQYVSNDGVLLANPTLPPDMCQHQ